VNNILTQTSITIGDQTYSVHLTTLPSTQQSSLLNPTSTGSFTATIDGQQVNVNVNVDNSGNVQSLTYHVQISPTLSADVVVNTQTHITTTTYSDGTLVTEQTDPTTNVVTTTTSRPDGTVQTQQTTPTTGATTDTLMKNGKLVSQTTTFANSVEVIKSQDSNNLSGYSTSVKLPGTFGTSISVKDPSQVAQNPDGSVTVQHQSYGIDPKTGKSGYYDNDLTVTSGTYSGVPTTKVVIVQFEQPQSAGVAGSTAEYVGTVYVNGSPIPVTQQGLDYWKSHTQTTPPSTPGTTNTGSQSSPYNKNSGSPMMALLKVDSSPMMALLKVDSSPMMALLKVDSSPMMALLKVDSSPMMALLKVDSSPMMALLKTAQSSPLISLLKSSSPLITMIKSATATSQILDFLNNLFQQFLQLFSNQQNKQATTGSVLEIPENITETTSIENILTTPITIPTISIPSVSQNFTNNLP
jgi:hypothetical protein